MVQTHSSVNSPHIDRELGVDVIPMGPLTRKLLIRHNEEQSGKINLPMVFNTLTLDMHIYNQNLPYNISKTLIFSQLMQASFLSITRNCTELPHTNKTRWPTVRYQEERVPDKTQDLQFSLHCR
jgi:hypothetical protein